MASSETKKGKPVGKSFLIKRLLDNPSPGTPSKRSRRASGKKENEQDSHPIRRCSVRLQKKLSDVASNVQNGASNDPAVTRNLRKQTAKQKNKSACTKKNTTHNESTKYCLRSVSDHTAYALKKGHLDVSAMKGDGFNTIVATYMAVGKGQSCLCKDCHKVFGNFVDLIQHLVNSDLPSCPYGCPSRPRNECEEMNHQLLFHQFVCKVCKKDFKVLNDLFGHIRHSHKKEANDLQGPFTFHGGHPIHLFAPAASHNNSLNNSLWQTVRAVRVKSKIGRQMDIARTKDNESKLYVRGKTPSQENEEYTLFFHCSLCSCAFKAQGGLNHHLAVSHKTMDARRKFSCLVELAGKVEIPVNVQPLLDTEQKVQIPENMQPSLDAAQKVQIPGKVQPSLDVTQEVQIPENRQPSLDATQEVQIPENTQPSLDATQEVQIPIKVQPSLEATQEVQGPEKVQPSLGATQEVQIPEKVQPSLDAAQEVQIPENVQLLLTAGGKVKAQETKQPILSAVDKVQSQKTKQPILPAVDKVQSQKTKQPILSAVDKVQSQKTKQPAVDAVPNVQTSESKQPVLDAVKKVLTQGKGQPTLDVASKGKIPSQEKKEPTVFLHCPLCTCAFMGQRGLDHHMAVAHNPNLKTSASDANTSLAHVKELAVSQPKCQECNTFFLSENSLMRHNKIMHSVSTHYKQSLVEKLKFSPNVKKVESPDPSHQLKKCSFCKMHFQNKISLSEHLIKEHKERLKIVNPPNFTAVNHSQKQEASLISKDASVKGKDPLESLLCQALLKNETPKNESPAESSRPSSVKSKEPTTIDLTQDDLLHQLGCSNEVNKKVETNNRSWHVPLGCYIGNMTNVHNVIPYELRLYIDNAFEEFRVDERTEIQPWSVNSDWEIFQLSHQIAKYLKLAPILKNKPQDSTQCQNYQMNHKFKIPMGHLNPDFKDFPLFPTESDVMKRISKYPALQLISSQELRETVCMDERKRSKRCKQLSKEIEKSFMLRTEVILRDVKPLVIAERRIQARLHESLVYRVCSRLRERIARNQKTSMCTSTYNPIAKFLPSNLVRAVPGAMLLTSGHPMSANVQLNSGRQPGIQYAMQLSGKAQSPSSTQASSATNQPLVVGVNTQNGMKLLAFPHPPTTANTSTTPQVILTSNTSQKMVQLGSSTKPIAPAPQTMHARNVTTVNQSITLDASKNTSKPNAVIAPQLRYVIQNGLKSKSSSSAVKLASVNGKAVDGLRKPLPPSGVNNSLPLKTDQVMVAKKSPAALFPRATVRSIHFKNSSSSQKTNTQQKTKKKSKLSKRRRDMLLRDWADVTVDESVFNSIILTKRKKIESLVVTSDVWNNEEKKVFIIKASKSRIFLENLRKSRKKFLKLKKKQEKYSSAQNIAKNPDSSDLASGIPQGEGTYTEGKFAEVC